MLEKASVQPGVTPGLVNEATELSLRAQAKKKRFYTWEILYFTWEKVSYSPVVNVHSSNSIHQGNYGTIQKTDW